MNDFILTAAVVWTFVLMAIVVLGLLRTPHPLTRILLVDFITLILIGILILYAIREDRPFYLDASLVLAALRLFRRQPPHGISPRDVRFRRSAVLELISIALIILGTLTITLGTVGLLRAPSIYTRVHTSSKAVTLGVISYCAAAFLTGDTDVRTRVVLIADLSAHHNAGGEPRHRAGGPPHRRRLIWSQRGGGRRGCPIVLSPFMFGLSLS